MDSEKSVHLGSIKYHKIAVSAGSVRPHPQRTQKLKPCAAVDAELLASKNQFGLKSD